MAQPVAGPYRADPLPSMMGYARGLYAIRENGPDIPLGYIGIPDGLGAKVDIHTAVATADLFAAAPALLSALEPELLEAAAEITGVEHGTRADALRALAHRQRAAIALAIHDAKSRPVEDVVGKMLAVLKRAGEYVERFADQNNEPIDGDCRGTLADIQAAIAAAELKLG